MRMARIPASISCLRRIRTISFLPTTSIRDTIISIRTRPTRFPSPEAVPSLPSFPKADGVITLSDINYSSDAVTFNVSVPSASLDYATIANPGKGVYGAGSTFKLELKDAESDPATKVAWSFDGNPILAEAVSLGAGTHSVEAEVSTKSGRTYNLELEIEVR